MNINVSPVVTSKFMYVVTLFLLLFYLYSYGCNVMFCVSPVSPLLFSRAYRFFSRVAAESAVWGICRFLRRGCVFRRGWCFCLCWYNWKVETPSVMLLGRLPCVSGCLDAKRPPVVSDGLYFCYWFCWYDCFWLFLRFRRGFVGKDEVPSPSLPYPPLVLPSALLFVLQQPAYRRTRNVHRRLVCRYRIGETRLFCRLARQAGKQSLHRQRRR